MRVLIYSHDSFGLGHLRRCREIAHAMVEHRKDASVLILSGSPIIGSFDFRSRVDFVRIPGVIKLRNGEYTSLNLHIDLQQTLAIRASIIQHTAEIFEPDLFIVDKEPLGLRGEVQDTLVMLKARGVPLILGLRDVMDEPALLAPEWRRKNVLPALTELYDEIWVYGLPQMCDPLADLELPHSVRRKMMFTGYLKRQLPSAAARAVPAEQDRRRALPPGHAGRRRRRRGPGRLGAARLRERRGHAAAGADRARARSCSPRPRPTSSTASTGWTGSRRSPSTPISSI